MDWTEQLRFKARGEDNASGGVRYPIWAAALHHKEYTFKLWAVADHSVRYIRLSTLSSEKSLMQTELPDLKYFTHALVKYLQSFHLELGQKVYLLVFCTCFHVFCVLVLWF